MPNELAEAGDRFLDDLRDRLHGVDAPNDLPAQGDGRFHIAAEVALDGAGKQSVRAIRAVTQQASRQLFRF